MKTVFLILTVLLSFKSYGQALEIAPPNFAADTTPASIKAPAPLTNSEIERKLETGEVQKFDGDEWMIVKRHAPKKKAAPPAPQIVEKVVEKVVEKTVTKKAPKNRLSLIAGSGPRGSLSVTHDGARTTVETDTGLVLGLEYQRDLDFKVLGLPVHAGAMYQNNRTLSGALGVSW